MKSDLREPCKSCPYRMDSPLLLWHRSEFQNLLANDADPLRGGQFACHQHRERDPGERSYCVGWLLDQRRRYEPSIQHRLSLREAPALRQAMGEISDGGHELYPSIEEMCAANGVLPEDARYKDDE